MDLVLLVSLLSIFTSVPVLSDALLYLHHLDVSKYLACIVERLQVNDCFILTLPIWFLVVSVFVIRLTIRVL